MRGIENTGKPLTHHFIVGIAHRAQQRVTVVSEWLMFRDDVYYIIDSYISSI